MSERTASTVANGVLAGLSVLLTAYVIPVPIWVLFIAWACFFATGGGIAGARTTLVMEVLGAVSATVTLLVATLLGGSGWVIALCVVVLGAGALVALGRFPALSFTPAGFLGFASVVGTIAATDSAITDSPSFAHPVVLVLVALVLGVGFGLLAETITKALSGSPAKTATPETPPATRPQEA